jgi:hypothetical protein
MRFSKALAVSVTGCALAAATALPATAGAAHAAHPAGKNGTFPSSLSASVAHPGTTLTLQAHGAKKQTNYFCFFTIVKGKKHGRDLSNTQTVTSSKKGKFHCSLTFRAFHGTIGGKTYHCPRTHKDTKAGIKCGFAAVDPATSQRSTTIQYFTAKH